MRSNRDALYLLPVRRESPIEARLNSNRHDNSLLRTFYLAGWYFGLRVLEGRVYHQVDLMIAAAASRTDLRD